MCYNVKGIPISRGDNAAMIGALLWNHNSTETVRMDDYMYPCPTILSQHQYNMGVFEDFWCISVVTKVLYF